MKPEDLLTIVCRPALPKDTPEVMKFTQQIWEGEDYIPRVWQDWLNDYGCFLTVAEYDGQIVGIGRLTQLSPDEWWLEGLRIRPQYQGRGFASHLHQYILSYWERKAGGTIRLGTASTRKKVHHLCEKNGFSRIAEFTLYKATALNQVVTSCRHLTLDEDQLAVDLISESPLIKLSHGLMDHGWEWSRPSTSHLRNAIIKNKAYWWQDKRGLIIYRDEIEGDQRFLHIQLLVCPLESLEDCLLDYRRMGAILGYESVIWLAPLHSDLQPVLRATGFERVWDDSLIIFEKKHNIVS